MTCNVSDVFAVFFYEEEEFVKHFNAAIEYIKTTPSLGITISSVTMVHSNGTDAVKLVTDRKDMKHENMRLAKRGFRQSSV
jgi:cystathionine beta-lyase/cystathionine gamma-synthase